MVFSGRTGQSPIPSFLHPGPHPRPDDWVKWVNRRQTEAELEALRTSVERGAPFGSERWQKRTARRMGLEFTLRPRGRPRTATKKVECPPFPFPSPNVDGLDRSASRGQRSAREISHGHNCGTSCVSRSLQEQQKPEPHAAASDSFIGRGLTVLRISASAASLAVSRS